jgi:hypothetical protein
MMPLWIISLLALELLTIGLLLGTAYREWLDERLLERLILGEPTAGRPRIYPQGSFWRRLLGD